MHVFESTQYKDHQGLEKKEKKRKEALILGPSWYVQKLIPDQSLSM